MLGRYSFTASTPAGGGLRPLRDPEAPELDDDEGGADWRRQEPARAPISL